MIRMFKLICKCVPKYAVIVFGYFCDATYDDVIPICEVFRTLISSEASVYLPPLYNLMLHMDVPVTIFLMNITQFTPDHEFCKPTYMSLDHINLESARYVHELWTQRGVDKMHLDKLARLIGM